MGVNYFMFLERCSECHNKHDLVKYKNTFSVLSGINQDVECAECGCETVFYHIGKSGSGMKFCLALDKKAR